MCEGPSAISGPIPPDPTLFPQYYKRPISARGRLEGNHDGTFGIRLGPLPPDPELYPNSYSSCTFTHRPRIGPNATHILERGQKGVVGDLLKLETVSVTAVPKQKQKVHDFGKQNIRQLREIQKRCKEQEAERAQSRSVPVKALWTSSKYQKVPSRVMAQMEGCHSSIQPQCQNFLKAHSNSGCKAPPRYSPAAAQHPVTSEDELELKVQGQAINFIKHNAKAAGKTVPRRSRSMTDLREKEVPSAVKGQVPQYLEKRKEQWRKEKEEKRRNVPDPTVPPGHTLMCEDERVKTLKSLKDTHRSLVDKLLTFPLKADSLSVRSRRAQLDCRLSEIEEAIKIFSRDKVYVKIDS